MITIGKEHQLFLDDVVLATSRNIDRRIHTAEKHPENPLITSSEGDGQPVLFGSIIPGENQAMTCGTPPIGTGARTPLSTMR
jgi:hypothetical protein